MFTERPRGLRRTWLIAHDEHILCLPDFMAEVLKVVVSRGPTHTSLSRQPAHPPRTPPPCSHSGLAATCGGGHSFGLRRGLTRCSIAALCIKVPKEKETPRSAANAFRVLLPLLSGRTRPDAGKVAAFAADISLNSSWRQLAALELHDRGIARPCTRPARNTTRGSSDRQQRVLEPAGGVRWEANLMSSAAVAAGLAGWRGASGRLPPAAALEMGWAAACSLRTDGAGKEPSRCLSDASS